MRSLAEASNSTSVANIQSFVAKTIMVCGYGPGIAKAVATRFGGEGFAVALVGRSAEKLASARSDLERVGIRSAVFPADLSDPGAMPALVTNVQAALGRITVVHWNAPANGAGDLATCDPFELRAAFDVSVTSLVATVQSALPDLKSQSDGAVLVTNGAVALQDPKLYEMSVDEGFMGAVIAKAAQHKVVSMLARRLRNDGVYVGEVLVAGIVKGTAYDTGNGILTTDEVATEFWKLYSERPVVFRAMIGVGLAGRGRP